MRLLRDSSFPPDVAAALAAAARFAFTEFELYGARGSARERRS